MYFSPVSSCIFSFIHKKMIKWQEGVGAPISRVMGNRANRLSWRWQIFLGKTIKFYLWNFYLTITLPCVCREQACERQGQRAPLLLRAFSSRGSIGKSNSPNLKKEQKDNTVFTQINKTCQQGNIWLLCFFLSVGFSPCLLKRNNKSVCRTFMWVDAVPSPIEPLYGLTLANGTSLEDEILQWFLFYFFARRWLCMDTRFASLLPWRQRRILVNSEHCYVEIHNSWSASHFATLRKVTGQCLLPRKDPDYAHCWKAFPLNLSFLVF